MENCNICNRSESTLADNVHQHAINKTLQTLDYIEYPTTFSTYKTEKNLVFSGSDQGGIKISPNGKVEDFKVTKDDRASFTVIGAYLRGQLYNKSGVSTVGNRLVLLNMIESLPGKAHAFIN